MTLWSPCGRHNEVVGGLRRLLVTSRTSSWVVPPPKVVFFSDAPGADAPNGCIARARSGHSERPSEPSFPEDLARQAASFAFGRMEIGGLAVYHAAADGRKAGGSRKAPSVSTWPTIPDKSLQVGGLVDTGWGLQPRRSKDPCGHSWMSDSLIPLQVDNRSSLGLELSHQPPLVRGGCHPRPGSKPDWHPG